MGSAAKKLKVRGYVNFLDLFPIRPIVFRVMSKPTDLHPGLTADRLLIVAEIINAARHECVALRNVEKGDSPWAIGCRAYAWICHALLRATLTYPWLKILEGGLHVRTDDGRDFFSVGLRFVFAVAGVPLRFYRGDPSDVPANSLRVTFSELAAQENAFLFRSESPKLLPNPEALRLAVETDDEGEVLRITLVQVLDADAKVLGERWIIFERVELDDLGRSPVTPFPTTPKGGGTDLGKPSVGSRKKKPEEEREGE